MPVEVRSAECGQGRVEDFVVVLIEFIGKKSTQLLTTPASKPRTMLPPSLFKIFIKVFIQFFLFLYMQDQACDLNQRFF